MTPPYRGSGSVDLERERQTAAWRAAATALAALGAIAVADLVVAVAEYAYVLEEHAAPAFVARLTLIVVANLLGLAGTIFVINRMIKRPSENAWIPLAALVGASLGAIALSTEVTRWTVTSLPDSALVEWAKDLDKILRVALLGRPLTIGAVIAYCMLRVRRLGPRAAIVCPHCAAPIVAHSAENKSSMS